MKNTSNFCVTTIMNGLSKLGVMENAVSRKAHKLGEAHRVAYLRHRRQGELGGDSIAEIFA